MSWRKRQLQRLGSWVVRQVSNTTVPDTTSGFRAYTREAALRMHIVSEFSYTLESIIQAGKKRMAIAHVPVATNPRTRESRLFDSMWAYVKRSGVDDRPDLRDVRAAEGVHVHRASPCSASGSSSPCGSSTCTSRRSRAAAATSSRSSLAAVLMIVGFQVLLIGLLADVMSANRKLLEDVFYRVRIARAASRGRRPRRRRRSPRARRTAATAGSTEWPIPPRSPSSSPPSTRPHRSRGVVSALRRAAPWREVDRGRRRVDRRDRRPRPRVPAPTVVRHPYNKGNGAAVKSGIRRATGDFVLIIDADGQHPPEDALRIVGALGEYDLVIGARAGATQATPARRARQQRAEPPRRLPHRTGRPRPDVRVPRRAPRASASSSCTCCRMASRPRRRRRSRSSRPATTSRSSRFTRASGWGSRRSGSPATAAGFLLIILKIVTLFSPMRIFLPISVASFVAGAGLRALDDRHAAAHHQLVRVVDHVRGRRVPRRARVRADLGAALRRPAVIRWSARGCSRRPRPAWRCGSAFGLVYWVGQPLTQDERDYLALARSLAHGDGFAYPPDEPLAGHAPAVRPRRRAIRCFWPRSASPARVAHVRAGAGQDCAGVLGAVGVWLIGGDRRCRAWSPRARRRGGRGLPPYIRRSS